MIKEKKVEPQENSNVKLTITVDKDAVKNQYHLLLKDYAKGAQIKGFRKGHVPTTVLERKFGESIQFEAQQKLMEESLKEVFEEIEEKPLPYCQPSLDGKVDFNIEEDLTFAVLYDVFPEIELGQYTGLEVEEPQVKVTDDDETREIKTLQEQNAIVMDKEEGVVESGDIVTVDYCEVDDQENDVEDTKREDFVFTQGSGYNVYKIDDDVLGMTNDEEKIVDKEYPEEFDDKDLAGTKKRLRIKVKAIKERQLPEIDDDLAQDISDEYETLDDLKKDIKARLQRTVDGRLRERKVNSLIEQIVASSTIPVPESMVAAELENQWHNFVNQFRMAPEQVEAMLAAQERTKDDLLAEWRDATITRVKGQLVVQKMLDLEEVEVSDEDIEKELDDLAETGHATREQLEQYYKQNNMLGYLKRDIKERRLFDKVLSESKIKKGKKMSFMDLLGRNE